MKTYTDVVLLPMNVGEVEITRYGYTDRIDLSPESVREFRELESGESEPESERSPQC